MNIEQIKGMILGFLGVLLLGAAFTANEQVTSTKLNSLNDANIVASAGIAPEKIDDHSATNAEMDETYDPYVGSAQTKPTDLSLEVKALRFQMAELLKNQPGAAGTEKWYNDPASGTQGDVIYHNGTRWAKLAAGTSGNFLKTQGAGANPAWDATGGFASSVRARITTDQTAANATDTTVIFGTEITDSLAEYNPATGIFTAQAAGTYLITTNIVWNNTSATGVRKVYICWQNTGNRRANSIITPTTAVVAQCVTDIVPLGLNETLFVMAHQTSGADAAMYGNADAGSYLSIQRVK